MLTAHAPGDTERRTWVWVKTSAPVLEGKVHQSLEAMVSSLEQHDLNHEFRAGETWQEDIMSKGGESYVASPGRYCWNVGYHCGDCDKYVTGSPRFEEVKTMGSDSKGYSLSCTNCNNTLNTVLG